MAKNKKKSDAVFEEIMAAVFGILKLAVPTAFAAFLANPKGQRATKAGARLAWSSTKRYGQKVLGEATFGLKSIIVLEFLAWPGKIFFAMWRSCIAYNHIHDAVYLANHYKVDALTVNVLFTESIFTVVLPYFILAMLVGVIQKMTLIRLGLVSGMAGFIGGLLGGLKFEDGKVIEAIKTALEKAGNGWSNAAAFMFRKGQNENWWSTACDLLIVIVPWFAGPIHPLATMIPATLAVKGLWEINTSGGNNTDIAGNSVLQTHPNGSPVQYHTWDRATGQVKVGYKPAHAWFQQLSLTILGVLIAGMCVLSYYGFAGSFVDIKIRERVATITTKEVGNIVKQHDREVRLLNAALAKVTADAAKRDSILLIRVNVANLQYFDTLGVRHQEFERQKASRIKALDGQLAKLPNEAETVAKQDSLNTVLASIAPFDTSAVRDSIAALATDRVTSVDALLPGKLAVTAHYATPDLLPPVETSRTLVSIQNFWYRLWWFIKYTRMLGPLIVIGLSVFGAKRKNGWARLAFWTAAVTISTGLSGTWWAAGMLAAVIFVSIIFGIFSPKGQTATASAH